MMANTQTSTNWGFGSEATWSGRRPDRRSSSTFIPPPSGFKPSFTFPSMTLSLSISVPVLMCYIIAVFVFHDIHMYLNIFKYLLIKGTSQWNWWVILWHFKWWSKKFSGPEVTETANVIWLCDTSHSNCVETKKGRNVSLLWFLVSHSCEIYSLSQLIYSLDKKASKKGQRETTSCSKSGEI